VKRLFIICEGQTEEQFVNEILVRHLAGRGLAVSAPLIGRPGHKGGAVTWPRVAEDLRRLLLGDGAAIATTLIDYYRLDSGFPGVAASKAKQGTVAKAQEVEQAMAGAAQTQMGFGAQRFIPYVQMHEFEGLLFSDPEAFAAGVGNSRLANPFRAIRQQFATPEDINDHPETAPSKRVLKLMPEYNKPLHGTLAALEMTLPTIRQACGLFHKWLSALEGRGSTNTQAVV
jgi:hypothetical protein